jgi:hypothetical protein
MAKKGHRPPEGWRAAQAQAEFDAMQGGPPAALLHPLAGPFVRVGIDLPIALQLGVSPEGRLICTGLLVEWQLNAINDPEAIPIEQRRELTARKLRSINLGKILNDLNPQSFGLPRRAKRAGAMPLPDWFRNSLHVVGSAEPGSEDEHYRNVAALYQEALLVQPGSPMKWLRAQLHCSEATAYRWRTEAEVRGFLPKRKRVRRGPPESPRKRPTPKRKGSR